MKLFITATGTGIGKTFVTSLLARQARRQGLTPQLLKPVLSGFDPRNPDNSDVAELIKASGYQLSDSLIDEISPFRYRAPLSPDMAAAREGRAINFDELISYCRQQEDAAVGPYLVEGVGGAMVPLTDNHLVLDWMVALNYPVLLVSGSYLGSISHCLCTLSAIENTDLSVAGILLNESPDSAVSTVEMADTLRRFVKYPIWDIPYLRDGDTISSKEIENNLLFANIQMRLKAM